MPEKQPKPSGFVLPDLEDPQTRGFWEGTARGELRVGPSVQDSSGCKDRTNFAGVGGLVGGPCSY